jgi:hypothetical protein
MLRDSRVLLPAVVVVLLLSLLAGIARDRALVQNVLAAERPGHLPPIPHD